MADSNDVVTARAGQVPRTMTNKGLAFSKGSKKMRDLLDVFSLAISHHSFHLDKDEK